MDLVRYENLLATIANTLQQMGDLKGSRLFSRWADRLRTETPIANSVLKRHVGEVHRSAQAIVILAVERHASEDKSLQPAVDELLAETTRITNRLRQIDAVLADRGLAGVAGMFLSSVEFVMDYVQLHFNSSTLTAFTSPEVREKNRIFRPSDSGYRDALCRRIAITVTGADVQDSERIAVDFADGSSVRISLRAEDCVGGESATFGSACGGLWVW